MVKNFFNKIFALLLGHYTVFKHSFKRRVTIEYPEVKPVLNERFRGRHVWNMEKCIGCKVCEKVCPAGAIKINKNDDGKFSFFVDLKRCIFCGNCSYYCKNNALNLSENFELATDKKSDLTIEINTLNFNNDGNIINNNSEDK